MGFTQSMCKRCEQCAHKSLAAPIDILTMSETIDLARSAMRQRKTTVHVAMNVAKLVNMRSDPVLAEDVKSGDIIGIDGMGILLAAKVVWSPG